MLKLPVHLRKQMLQNQAAWDSRSAPEPVRVIIAQGQFIPADQSVLVFLVWEDGTQSDLVLTDAAKRQLVIPVSSLCPLSQKTTLGCLEWEQLTTCELWQTHRNHMLGRSKIGGKAACRHFLGPHTLTLKAVLLSYNSHAIHFTHLQCTTLCVLAYSQGCETIIKI